MKREEHGIIIGEGELSRGHIHDEGFYIPDFVINGEISLNPLIRSALQSSFKKEKENEESKHESKIDPRIALKKKIDEEVEREMKGEK